MIVSDSITIPLLFGSTFLMGGTFSLMGPARQSWVVELVPQRLLPNAVALQNMSINIAAVIGPALAAILVVSMGLNSGILYMLVAVPFVIVIPLTLDDQRQRPRDPARGTQGDGDRDGWPA